MTREEYINSNYDKHLYYWSNVTTGIGTFAVLSLILLDYFASPSNFKIFFYYRIIVSLCLIIIYFSNRKKINRAYQSAISILAGTIVAVMIALMIAKFGGHQSVYFAGFILLIIYISGLIPLTLQTGLIASSIIYLIYLLPILSYDTITNKPFFISSNIFILSCTGALLLLRYLSHKRLVTGFGLQYDIEQQKEQLKIYSQQLEDLVQERTKELNKSEMMLRSLFENANDGIMIMDRNGIILNVNQKACEIHGFDRDALIGTNIELLEGGGNERLFRERMERILNGESLQVETQHYRRDGGKISLEISTRAVEVESNILIQSFHRDITEKKQLYAQLFQSQKMESVGVLAGGIAHNFNNILTGILGHVELMRMNSELDEKIIKRLNIIENSARKASDIISKLLRFARRGNYETLSCNLNDIVSDTVELIEKGIDKKISFRVELDNNIPLIEGDINQMEQVIMNLIVNAQDAMPDGGLILIKTGCVEVKKDVTALPQYIQEGRYVQMRISDTGCGIPDGIINKIFEPFFTTKEQGKGTGLGLSMVYGTIKKHRGYITVKSKINEGSIFDIYIPAPEKFVPLSRKKSFAAIRRI